MHRIQISTENIFSPVFRSWFVLVFSLSCVLTALPKGCASSIGAAADAACWPALSPGDLENGQMPNGQINIQPSLGHPQGVGASCSPCVWGSPTVGMMWRDASADLPFISLCLCSSVSSCSGLRCLAPGQAGETFQVSHVTQGAQIR